MSIFCLENENIYYNKAKILNNLSLSINAGERVALVGKSGSGKSTLIKSLIDKNNKDVAIVPQELGLVDNLSSFHNVYIGRLDNNSFLYNLFNLIKPISKEVLAITAILEKLQIDKKLFSKIAELSGGQKQRVAIARTIYKGSSVLVADEPVSALDNEMSHISLELIKNSFNTYVLALHNIFLAKEYCNRIIGIKDSHIYFDCISEDVNEQMIAELYKD